MSRAKRAKNSTGFHTKTKAVSRISGYRFPVGLNEVTRAYFQGGGREFEKAAEKVSETPQYSASLRTTCTPTVIEAGFKNSAIPGKVKANVNYRVLPTDDPEQVVAQLRKVIDDSKVVVTIPEEADKPAMFPFSHPFFDSVKKIMKELAPDAVTVPYMSSGATDSRKLRYRGLKAYGLVPLPMAVEDKMRMHGNDERVKVSSIGFGVDFLYRLVVDFAGSRNP